MVRFLSLIKLNKKHLLETFLNRRNFPVFISKIKRFDAVWNDSALPSLSFSNEHKKNEWDQSRNFYYFKNTATFLLFLSFFPIKSALCESKRNDKTEREKCNKFKSFA
jgi:hypothetical protein